MSPLASDLCHHNNNKQEIWDSQQKVKPLKQASGAFRMRHSDPICDPPDPYYNLTGRVKGKMHKLRTIQAEQIARTMRKDMRSMSSIYVSARGSGEGKAATRGVNRNRRLYLQNISGAKVHVSSYVLI
jgi:hypothetical protein